MRVWEDRMALELFQRRLDELQAILGIFGSDCLLQAAPEELFAFLLTGGTEAAGVVHLSAQPIYLSLMVPAPEPSVADVGAREPLAVLHATLPLGYPAAEPCACFLSSMKFSGQRQTAATASLQSLANEAAAAGRECLFDLFQAAEEMARDAAAPSGAALRAGGEAAVGANGPSSSGVDGAAEASQSSQHQDQTEVQLALLRVDHMHDRRGYCKTVRRWCRELGLTGRLLFLGSLILVLLEGAAGDVRECLARWRTRSVDVDSKGRPCKERMMDVVAEEARQRRCFETFEELELRTFEELQGVLEQAGAAGWLAVAAGFVPNAGRGFL